MSEMPSPSFRRLLIRETTCLWEQLRNGAVPELVSRSPSLHQALSPRLHVLPVCLLCHLKNIGFFLQPCSLLVNCWFKQPNTIFSLNVYPQAWEREHLFSTVPFCQGSKTSRKPPAHFLLSAFDKINLHAHALAVWRLG